MGRHGAIQGDYEIPGHPRFNLEVTQDGYSFDMTEYIHDRTREMMRRVVQAEDDAIRAGLKSLGWTPPDELRPIKRAVWDEGFEADRDVVFGVPESVNPYE